MPCPTRLRSPGGIQRPSTHAAGGSPWNRGAGIINMASRRGSRAVPQPTTRYQVPPRRSEVPAWKLAPTHPGQATPPVRGNREGAAFSRARRRQSFLERAAGRFGRPSGRCLDYLAAARSGTYVTSSRHGACLFDAFHRTEEAIETSTSYSVDAIRSATSDGGGRGRSDRPRSAETTSTVVIDFSHRRVGVRSRMSSGHDPALPFREDSSRGTTSGLGDFVAGSGSDRRWPER